MATIFWLGVLAGAWLGSLATLAIAVGRRRGREGRRDAEAPPAPGAEDDTQPMVRDALFGRDQPTRDEEQAFPDTVVMDASALFSRLREEQERRIVER